ncbi:hypothetical protein SASC598P14_001040, partial [Snodgrassella alvi SCGC AB-598-P14]
LRVIRHRGGYIQSMNMHAEQNKELLVKFDLINSKAKSQITTQLLKLADIIAID